MMNLQQKFLEATKIQKYGYLYMVFLLDWGLLSFGFGIGNLNIIIFQKRALIQKMDNEIIEEANKHIVTNHDNYHSRKIIGTFLPSQAFATQYDPNNEFIAYGCNNGTKILYSIKQRAILTSIECPLEQPATCVKWRPTVNTKIKVLGTTNTAGIFEYYHVPTMKKLFSIEEKENSLHCCDFSKTGEHFATAGKDAHIRIYDQNTKSLTTDLGCAQWNNRGHSNRIFSIKFIDDNTIISGGWDSVIHQWDIRQGKSVRSVFGAHVAGDSIDYQNGEVLIGCYASKNQIQIWDYNKFTMKQSITWTTNSQKDKVAYVYTATYANFENNTILAGSCGVNEVKVFRRKDGEYKLTSHIQGIQNGIYSVDSSHSEQEFTFTTAHDGMFIYGQEQQK